MRLFLSLAWSLLLLEAVVPFPLQAHPFTVGERLEFEISWMGVPAGYSLLEVKGQTEEGGRTVYEVESRTWSNKFISTFFPVEDRIECLMDANDLSGVSFRMKQREGSYRKEKEIIFDQSAGRASYSRNGRVSHHDVPPPARDSLASFYYMRTLKLEPGRDVVMDTFSNGRLYKTTFKVLGREVLEIEGAQVATLKVQPLAQHNDVFNNKGEIFVWLTDDGYKIPVRIRSEIAIGHFTAEIRNLNKGAYRGNRPGTAGHTRLSEVQR